MRIVVLNRQHKRQFRLLWHRVVGVSLDARYEAGCGVTYRHAIRVMADFRLCPGSKRQRL